MPATVLLKALGYSTDALLNYFYKSEEIIFDGDNIVKSADPELLTNQKAAIDITDQQTGEVILKANRKFTKAAIRKMAEHGIKNIPITPEDIVGKYSCHDIIDDATGEIIVECNDEITPVKLAEIRNRNISSIKVLFIDNLHVTSSFRDTI